MQEGLRPSTTPYNIGGFALLTSLFLLFLFRFLLFQLCLTGLLDALSSFTSHLFPLL